MSSETLQLLGQEMYQEWPPENYVGNLRQKNLSGISDPKIRLEYLAQQCVKNLWTKMCQECLAPKRASSPYRVLSLYCRDKDRGGQNIGRRRWRETLSDYCISDC